MIFGGSEPEAEPLRGTILFVSVSVAPDKIATDWAEHFSELWDAVDDWPANRDPHTIVHELDAAEDRELHPWAWPKTGASSVRSQRSMNSSPVR